MRKIKVFSSMTGYQSISTSEKSSIVDNIDEGLHREQKEFMTPSLLKMMMMELKRPINIRFLRLIRSSKQYIKSLKKVEDVDRLKIFVVQQLSFMLSEYADMLAVNNNLQLTVYLKINSVAPGASTEARTLSRIMIRANKVRLSQGFLPQKNQRDLGRALNAFIQAVVEEITSKMDPKLVEEDDYDITE